MTPSPPHVRHGPPAAVPSGAAAEGEVPRGPESQKNHFSTCRVDGIPARQAGKPNLRHCRGRFLFPAICLQTLYSFPSCGILRKKNPFAEVRPARGRPGPAGKSGATPARSRRCMRRGLPSGVSQGPLPPCHCPPLGAEKAKMTGASQKACFCVFPCSSAWKRTGPGPPGSPAVPPSPCPLGPGAFGPYRRSLTAWWAESGVRRSLLPRGGRAAGFFAGSAGLGNGFLLQKRKEVS